MLKRKLLRRYSNLQSKKDDKHQHQTLTNSNLKKSVGILVWVSQFVSKCHIKNSQEHMR